jgi:polygalacturonase
VRTLTGEGASLHQQNLTIHDAMPPSSSSFLMAKLLWPLAHAIVARTLIAESRGQFGGAVAPVIFNVMDYGAVGDGIHNDTSALQSAMDAAAMAAVHGLNTTVLLPGGFTFLSWATRLTAVRGVLRVDGKLQAPRRANWHSGPYSGAEAFLYLGPGVGISLTGTGRIDGAGLSWAGVSQGKPDLVLMRNVTCGAIANVALTNAPSAHIAIDHCASVQVAGVHIAADSEPGTDSVGISTFFSRDLWVHDCFVQNDDDGVTIQNGCSNVLVENCGFNGSHGVSIGGLLGLNNSVSDVVVRNCAFFGGTAAQSAATAAVRIKSEQRASGVVRNVSYFNISVVQIGLPVHIDQFYCADDRALCDKAFETSLVIENVSVIGLSGSQLSGYAGIVNCSFGNETRCRGLVLENISIKSAKPNASNVFSCSRAAGVTIDVSPSGCDLQTLRG